MNDELDRRAIEEYRQEIAEIERRKRWGIFSLIHGDIQRGGHPDADEVAAVPLYGAELRALLRLLKWYDVAADEPLTEFVEGLHGDLLNRWTAVAGHRPEQAPIEPPRTEGAELADRYSKARQVCLDIREDAEQGDETEPYDEPIHDPGNYDGGYGPGSNFEHTMNKDDQNN